MRTTTTKTRRARGENGGEQTRCVASTSRARESPVTLTASFHSPPQPKPLSRDQRRAYRAQLAKYESKGSSYGQSVACMMYLLAEGLGRADIDSVWCAVCPLQATGTPTADIASARVPGSPSSG